MINNSAILSNPAFKQALTVKRTASGQWDAATGKWLSGAAQTPLLTHGSVQPATFKDMQYLTTAVEGGQQVSAAIRIYSVFEFVPAVLGTNGNGGDIVEYKGLDWIIVQVADFAVHGHQKVFGVRIDAQNG